MAQKIQRSCGNAIPDLLKSKLRKSLWNAEYQRVEKGLTLLQGFSFSPRWQQGCWVHRSHTDFTFNPLSRIKKGFKVNAPILICSPEKTFLVNKWRFSLLNTVPNTIILSLHSIHCIYFKKTAQQHSGHNSKPQESSATANEIRCWNVHFSEADEGSDHFWKSATLY